MSNYKCLRCEYHFSSKNEIPYCPACDCESLEDVCEKGVVQDVVNLMSCQKCSNQFDSPLIEQHHIHPKFMNNKTGLGKKANLCRGCHMELHLIIQSIIWNNLNNNKELVIKEVINFTEQWLK